VIYTLTVDREQTSGIVGAVLSAYGVGYLAGAIVAGRISRRPLGPLMLVSNVVAAVVIAAFAVISSVPVLLAGGLVAGFSEAQVLIAYITLRATIPPDELLGRVGSVARMISIGLAPVGLFIGGVLLDTLGGGATMAIIGLAMLAATGVFALSATLRHAAAPIRPSTAS
jgi:predicted MFS family arabinose efflux permease